MGVTKFEVNLFSAKKGELRKDFLLKIWRGASIPEGKGLSSTHDLLYRRDEPFQPNRFYQMLGKAGPQAFIHIVAHAKSANRNSPNL